jgi:hypothetical protein
LTWVAVYEGLLAKLSMTFSQAHGISAISIWRTR